MLPEFQFHKGTIKTSEGINERSPIAHFNSIKVQLKPKVAALAELVSKFQFHKGTIKTKLLLRLELNTLEFQFHKGTIKTKDIVNPL